MTDHTTLDPAHVRAHDDEPPGVATQGATSLDPVWADHDLLRAEFDAIIAANFPDVVGSGRSARPCTAVGAATRRPPAPPAPTSPPLRSRWDRTAPPTDWRARQRSPPAERLGVT